MLSTATIEADAETAAALGVELVLEVVRVRLADGEPISLERASFPAERFPGLLDRSLSGSLYELLQSEYGLEPGEAEERIEVVAAGADEARLLGVARGAPLLTVARTTWDADGTALRALARPLPRRPRPDRRARTLGGCGRAGLVTLATSPPQVVECGKSSDNFVHRGNGERGADVHYPAGAPGRGAPRGDGRVRPRSPIRGSTA